MYGYVTIANDITNENKLMIHFRLFRFGHIGTRRVACGKFSVQRFYYAEVI